MTYRSSADHRQPTAYFLEKPRDTALSAEPGKGLPGLRPTLAAAFALLLAACTSAPTTESPVLPNVKELRSLDDIRVEINEYDDPFSLGAACLAERDPITIAMLTLTQGPFAFVAHRACAKVGKKWCRVHVPAGDAELLEHELAHCRGYNDDKVQVTEAQEYERETR